MFLIYAVLLLIVFTMNVVPLFMPPTWIVLAFFYSHYHLSLFPTVLVGAFAATFGRVILSLLARNYFGKLIPKKMLENYEFIGKFFEKNERFTLPAVLAYAFFPLSSNYVFIIIGLSKISLKLISPAFFFGRLISYSFWVSASHLLVRKLEDLFSQRLSNWNTLVLEIAGLLIVYLIGTINWKKILKF